MLGSMISGMYGQYAAPKSRKPVPLYPIIIILSAAE